MVRLRTLGGVTLTTSDGEVISSGMRTDSYAVLALLAAQPAGWRLPALVDTLYPEIDSVAATNRVRTAITTTRRVLRATTGHPDAWFITHHPDTGIYQRHRYLPTPNQGDKCGLWR